MSLSVCDVVFLNNKWKKIKFIDSANTERKKRLHCFTRTKHDRTSVGYNFDWNTSVIGQKQASTIVKVNCKLPSQYLYFTLFQDRFVSWSFRGDRTQQSFSGGQLRQEIITSDVSETNSISIISAMRSDCVLNCRCLCSHTWDWGMAMELVSETSDVINLLTRLSARESFVKIDSFHILPHAVTEQTAVTKHEYRLVFLMDQSRRDRGTVRREHRR